MSFRFLPHQVAQELKDYLNADAGSLHRMTEHTQAWLSDRPELRPNAPITLYRGLNFTKHDADAFLRGATEGDTLKTSWARLSSWSSIRGVATRYALNSKELPFADMKKEFLDREDDEIGVVVELLATPRQILCSVQRLVRLYHLRDKFTKDWEYILRPMTTVSVRVRALYTKDSIVAKTSLEDFE